MRSGRAARNEMLMSALFQTVQSTNEILNTGIKIDSSF